MKQILRWSASFLAVCLVLFTAPTAAQAKGKPKPKVPFMGIVSVDTTAMTISIEPKNSTASGVKTYKYNAKTVITVNGQPGTPASLTPGQQIHVGLSMDGKTAETLAVTPPPAG